ncbi:mitochondrial import inner membrane translocase subunit Tim23 [Cloeon dipterum]|uniref:mitochondrial import inner membrane translocase subunit Tim23 n=1 Tax=Cloeon dipterum TaxID=197152 RepID=UPI00321F7371
MYAQSFGGQGDNNLASLSPNVRPLSPFLNIDPNAIRGTQPEFIFPEGAARQRGRFELAFSQIGGSCMIGAAIGGGTGLYKGLRASTLAGETGKLRRTQVLNHVMKQGAASANTLGVVAVMYSGFGVLLSWARGEDDEYNTLAAASATGLLFKSSAGLKRCMLGGGVGFGLAAVYCLWASRVRMDNVRTMHF